MTKFQDFPGWKNCHHFSRFSRSCGNPADWKQPTGNKGKRVSNYVEINLLGTIWYLIGYNRFEGAEIMFLNDGDVNGLDIISLQFHVT